MVAGKTTENLVLIDGNSLINRAFYATPLLTNKDGQYTNAVFGFINMLVKIMLENKPKYLAVAFDVKQPTFRHTLFTEYKAGRKVMPEELRTQLDLLKEVLGAMKVCCIEQAGIEADDVLGTLSKRFPEQTAIVTGDKDALQLIDKSTVVWLTKKGLSDIQEVTEDNIAELFGVSRPARIVDLKSLMGDKSDNIPGVAGIGEKTAVTLLRDYETLDGVYVHLEDIPGKLHDKLAAGKDSAYLSYRLATIKTDAVISCGIEDCVYPFPFSNEVYDLFKRLGFNSLTKRENLFSAEAAVREQTAEKTEIESPEALKTALAGLTGGPVAVEFSKHVHLAETPERELVVKVQDNFLDGGFDLEQVLSGLKPLLESADAPKLVFDAKTLRHRLAPFGVELAGVQDDAAVAAYVAGYGNLSTLTDFLQKRGYTGDTLAANLVEAQRELAAEIERLGNAELYALEIKVSAILYDMEEAGFKIDGEVLNALGEKFTAEIDELTQSIYEAAGRPFNINSPKQLGALLFEELKLPSGRKTKTGYSTDNEVLEGLGNEHAVVPLIIKYRQIAKLNNTYIEGFRPLIDAGGKVHTEFKQMLTTTGRLSSTDPNLQNIPVRDGVGKEIRRMFVPEHPDGFLVSADYSQIELRLLAHLSGDAELIRAYNEGQDIHTSTAMAIFGVPQELVTPNMRRSAKAINFGLIYGKGDFSLAKDLGITRKAAREYIDRYFARYPSVKDYLNGSVEFAKKNGYVRTILGRIRKINEITSSNFNTRSYGERAAMNMPLQGSAADIIKLAMVSVSEKMRELKLKSKLILQVHDELIVDATADERDIVAKLLKREMENVLTLKVPLVADVGYASNWYEAK